MRMQRSALWLGLALLGCDGAAPAADAAPEGARCLDDAVLERCAGGGCERQTCRSDELCQDAACVPWVEASLWADFTLSYSDAVERRVIVEVLPGGFPRRRVEALRFSFGDGVSGWGEALSHDYDAPGVYPVELEVRLEGMVTLRASRLAVVEPPPGHQPLSLTVNEIGAPLDGSEPLVRDGGTPDDPSDDVTEPFTLLVPRSGFTVDVALLEDPADPVDRSSLSLTADQPMGARPVGTELADLLEWNERQGARVGRARWVVGPDEAAPEGRVTFRLSARTESGAAHERSLEVEATALTAELDPFDRPMVWLFRTDTDFFTTTASEPGRSHFDLLSEPTPNGRPDLEEELALIGAQGPDEGSNAIYLGWIREALRRETYRYFGVAPDGTPRDGIPLTITWQGEPGAPEPQGFDPAGSFSMMRFGGVFDGFVGFSGYSPHNELRVDDSTAGRGVATASLIGTLVSTPAASEAFDPIKPGIGAPVGTHPADAAALSEGFDPDASGDEAAVARHAELTRIARYLALVISSVTAHEMGHAMGLMPNGPPPDGFFGAEGDVSFVGADRTNSHHADLPGLNLMQAGGDYLGVLDEALATLELPRSADLILLAQIIALENRLSPYARAYLQGRLTYRSFEGAGGGWSVGCRAHR